MYHNFRHFLRKTATGEIYKHSKRRSFPGTDDFRKLKEYLNSKYKGRFLPDKLINDIENCLDEYEALKVGGSNG